MQVETGVRCSGQCEFDFYAAKYTVFSDSAPGGPERRRPTAKIHALKSIASQLQTHLLSAKIKPTTNLRQLAQRPGHRKKASRNTTTNNSLHDACSTNQPRSCKARPTSTRYVLLSIVSLCTSALHPSARCSTHSSPHGPPVSCTQPSCTLLFRLSRCNEALVSTTTRPEIKPLLLSSLNHLARERSKEECRYSTVHSSLSN